MDSKEEELKALAKELKLKNEEIYALKAHLEHLDHDDVNSPVQRQPSTDQTMVQSTKEEK